MESINYRQFKPPWSELINDKTTSDMFVGRESIKMDGTEAVIGIKNHLYNCHIVFEQCHRFTYNCTLSVVWGNPAERIGIGIAFSSLAYFPFR